MPDNLLEDQEGKRNHFLNLICASKSPKRLIVAGPGTGKSYTFAEVLKKSSGTNNLGLTFIRRLAAEMQDDLGDLATAETFHKFCKRMLHTKNGNIVLAPYLTEIIKSDADLIGFGHRDFNERFQLLDREAPEIRFYLGRGSYYEAVCFNDSVFKLYEDVIEGSFSLPTFDQIVVDEYQDFNPLEVAFLGELEKKSPILIVGDDDQAVYIGRSSSPQHLRDLYRSGAYETFELPFCSRSPRVIVEAAAAFIRAVVETGGFAGRVDRAYVPFLQDKAYENSTYPKITKAMVSNMKCLSGFISDAISQIPPLDLERCLEAGCPAVLIVGTRQYLNPVAKALRPQYPNVEFAQSPAPELVFTEAYDLLVTNNASNLGWRILAELRLHKAARRAIIKQSMDGTPMVKLLPGEFLRQHQNLVALLRRREDTPQLRTLLGEMHGAAADELALHFFPPADEEEKPPENVERQPQILLSSFEGCKGLSAGHVFVVGLNAGVMPGAQENDHFPDIECSKFVVALTRTRQKCYLLSNWLDFGPQPKHRPSPFLKMIPNDLVDDLGFLRTADLHK